MSQFIKNPDVQQWINEHFVPKATQPNAATVAPLAIAPAPASAPAPAASSVPVEPSAGVTINLAQTQPAKDEPRLLIKPGTKRRSTESEDSDETALYPEVVDNTSKTRPKKAASSTTMPKIPEEPAIPLVRAIEQAPVRKRKEKSPDVPVHVTPVTVREEKDTNPERERSPRREEAPQIELPIATTKRPKNEASEKGEDVPFLEVDINDDNARKFLGKRGGPTVDVFVHAIEAYNKSVDPDNRIDYQTMKDYKGSQTRYASYLRGLLERRVSIVDKREGHNRKVFNAFRNDRGRRAVAA